LQLWSPEKVDIPERYIPEDEEELTAEERERREKKVERIRKLLSAQRYDLKQIRHNASVF
jgi:hypothetical protein